MTLSMYQASVPILLHHLQALSTLLDKTAADGKKRNIEEDTFLRARLAPDMYNLRQQIEFALLHAQHIGARLAGLEIPARESQGYDWTMDDMKASIDEVVEYLTSLKPEQFEDSEKREIEFSTGTRHLKYTGSKYLLNFAMPNFYFHYVTAYDILRANGVQVGKIDFLGQSGG